GHPGGTWALALAPDGKAVASYGADNNLRLWYGDALKEGRLLGAPRDTYAGLAFSPDGTVLATGGKDQWLGFRAADTGKELAHGEDQGSPLTAVAFSPDGKWLATANRAARMKLGDRGGRVYVWAASAAGGGEPGDPVRTFTTLTGARGPDVQALA